ncbi:response regulator [Geomonas anaerohicana]|uniref:Response regulator n=1 Tax=Geomonas anaerohicana TaxID=2798583 RepID=A0ABS0YJD4_9BACT|nr:response regulator [Geomonas anaerohicana]MBJ6752405.1 response regulator [Geomonas anaerohicana]
MEFARQAAQPKEHSTRKKLGEIFVERGILSAVTVERVVAYARKKGKRFGTVLEELELVTPDELAQALAQQHNLKFLGDFHRYRYADDLLRLIPAKTAMANLIFPLKRQEGKLAVAVSDPTLSEVLRAIAEEHKVGIVPYVAPRREIMLAIKVHYLKSAPAAASDKKSVLIVDDDQAVSQFISGSLRRKGYHVVCAGDGMEAFKEIMSNRFDLVITDKEMPKLNGYAVLESLRTFPDTAHVPVILITSTATVDEEATALRRGFFDFIPKPLREATLSVKVERALAMAGEY